jgi:hypothetical protein
MLNFTEQSTSGTCRKISMVPNGGSGSSRMSGSTKILFVTLFVVHYNNY